MGGSERGALERPRRCLQIDTAGATTLLLPRPKRAKRRAPTCRKLGFAAEDLDQTAENAGW